MSEEICIICNKKCDCIICIDICNNKNIDINVKEKINNLILEGCKITSLVEHFKNVDIAIPSQYHLKNHQEKCLKINIDEVRKNKKLELKENEKEIKIEKVNFQQTVDMYAILEEYRNKTFQERETDYLKMLREVDYMSLFSIHHQLLHGKFSGAVVPKEDIGALKNVQDILQVLTVNTFDDEEIPEININVMNTQSNNESILKQFEFPLSKDPSSQYKNLIENINESENEINNDEINIDNNVKENLNEECFNDYSNNNTNDKTNEKIIQNEFNNEDLENEEIEEETKYDGNLAIGHYKHP